MHGSHMERGVPGLRRKKGGVYGLGEKTVVIQETSIAAGRILRALDERSREPY